MFFFEQQRLIYVEVFILVRNARFIKFYVETPDLVDLGSRLDGLDNHCKFALHFSQDECYHC